MTGEIRVLGPVEAVGPQGSVELIGARQRALIAILALRVGTMVPTTKLVDALWGEDPPRTAVKTLHSHVARVRQALGACGLTDVLRTREPGYELAVTPGMVDAVRFETGVRAARDELTPMTAIAQLREHLGLWRGEPLADVEVFGWAAAEVERLREARLSALEDVWEAELRVGRHRLAVAELDRLLVQHALRERLVGLSMLALYRCGRQADALQSYQRLRARLADELGVDPGPELTELYAKILRNDSELAAPTRPNPRLPAQLPARVGHFAGRVTELDALDAMLDSAVDSVGADRPLVAISGPAGMGKTALAVQWAHRIAPRFPDGHLFLDLRGHDGTTAVRAPEALAYLLRSLGVPGDRVPAEQSEQAGLFRSLMHGKRILMVLDNVPATVDILPLVPGTATCTLILTSRSPLLALAAQHAVHAVRLDALSEADALSLVRLVLGADRVDREPDSTAELVELCGRMPLALRIATAKLVSEPRKRISDLVTELAGTDRLDVLSVEGDSYSVRAVFASVYRGLSVSAARAFRLLGLHPGVTFTTELAMVVCASPMAEIEAAHLVSGVAPNRYRFHDLIRLFARHCADIEETPETRAQAVHRILDWYLGKAYQANLLLQPRRDRVALPDHDHDDFADQQEALAFLDAEKENLLPVVEYGARHGQHVVAWQLAYLLTSFFDVRGHGTERLAICQLGVAAARETGDFRAIGEMLRALGVAYHKSREFTAALAVYSEALDHVRACGDQEGESYIFGNIANTYTENRQFADAITAYQKVIAIHAERGNTIGTALAQRNLGYAYVQMGQPEPAMPALAAALAGSQEIGNRWLEAGTLDSLGEASLRQQRFADAVAYFSRAVTISQQIGDRCAEATALANIGAVSLRQNDSAGALGSLRRALTIAREAGDRHIEARVLNLIGQAELELGHTQSARGHFTLGLAARELVPDSYEEAHLQRNLGELAHRLGDSAGSVRHWDLAIQLYGKANADEEALALRRDSHRRRAGDSRAD